MSAPDSSRSPEVTAAYTFCRAIAKREAKNFYYAFRVLPQHKSDAMCAVYAFMRKADDLADDESLTVPERREAMARWTAEWRNSRTQPTTDPVFVALKDAQQRFGISDELLEQLVAGTTLDLVDEPDGVANILLHGKGESRTVQIYETQESLEHYCYLVASVVGLVCIRIFGYTEARAESLAIDTGKAFQLTNILRDIKEDADRGRIYLPLSLLDEFGVSTKRLLALTKGAETSSAEKAMLYTLGARAEPIYQSAEELIPLLSTDSRPAMRVLVEIYHRLLNRTSRPEGVSLHTRVSVPPREKLAILARGIIGSMKARIFS